MRVIFFISLLATTLLGLPTNFDTHSARSWNQIKKSGVLNVLTTNSDNTYFEDKEGNGSGFEYDLAKAFAEDIGLKLNIVTKDTLEELFRALERGEGDFIAAGLSITPQRQQRFLFSPHYFTVQPKVVCRRGLSPQTIGDLQNLHLVVTAGSSHQERLEDLEKDFKNLNWTLSKKDSVPELIKKISQNKIDCTIADSNVIAIYRRYFPDIRVAFSLGAPENFAWFLQRGQHDLQLQMDRWLQNRGLFVANQLKKSYYSHVKDFDRFDIKRFLKRIRTRLPKYRHLFMRAEEETGWSWTLLAAIAYQESHWNPRAVSPTGVRGLMMLTQGTARAMGVTNRTDPEQSVLGGARYLKRLYQRLPNYINSSDKIWMTLASYNIGLQHLRDAQGVAAWKNKNPNSWTGVRSVLPLLAQKDVYSQVPHGYARGLEPVLYVDRIRNYYKILRTELRRSPRLFAEQGN